MWKVQVWLLFINLALFAVRLVSMEMQADEKPATRSESVLPVYVSSVPIETDIKKKKKWKRIRVLKYLQKSLPRAYLFGCLSRIRVENNTEQQMTEQWLDFVMETSTENTWGCFRSHIQTESSKSIVINCINLDSGRSTRSRVYFQINSMLM